MTLDDAKARALEVRGLFEQLELKKYGRRWTSEEIALGFVGDVGDLAKLVLADEGVRSIDNHREKLGHELSDCLWSVLVLADRCGIDLETEFANTMDKLDRELSNYLSK